MASHTSFGLNRTFMELKQLRLLGLVGREVS